MAEKQTPIKPHSLGDGDAFMALPGKLVKATIAKFCQKECDPPQVLDSIGVGRHGIAATDRYRGIIIGEPEQAYAVTDRRCAALESDRATIYSEGYDAGKVLPVEGAEDPDNCPPAGDFPGIGKIISEVDAMRYLASIDPTYLRDLATVALAGNTSAVALYVDDKGEKVKLGFRFTHRNDDPAFGEALEVPIVGIIMGRAVTKEKSREEEEDPEEPRSISEKTVDGMSNGSDAAKDLAASGSYFISANGKKTSLGPLDADKLVEEAAYWMGSGEGKTGLQAIQTQFQCGKDRAQRIKTALSSLGVIGDLNATIVPILVKSPEDVQRLIEGVKAGTR